MPNGREKKHTKKMATRWDDATNLMRRGRRDAGNRPVGTPSCVLAGACHDHWWVMVIVDVSSFILYGRWGLEGLGFSVLVFDVSLGSKVDLAKLVD